MVAAETGCGATMTPWILEALPGQLINITLWDFTYATVGGAFNLEYGEEFSDKLWPSCHDLVILRENNRQVSLG